MHIDNVLPQTFLNLSKDLVGFGVPVCSVLISLGSNPEVASL